MTEEDRNYQREYDRLIRLAVKKGNIDKVMEDLKDMNTAEDVDHYIQNVQMPKM